MADLVLVRNIGAYITTRRGSGAGTGAQTAGATATITGATIDREGFAGGSLPDSMQTAFLYDSTLASGKTLVVYFDVQHSTNNSTFTDFATGTGTTTVTGASGGSVQQGSISFNVNLHGAYRYIRTLVVPSLSATGTDTITGLIVDVVAGYDRLAAPA